MTVTLERGWDDSQSCPRGEQRAGGTDVLCRRGLALDARWLGQKVLLRELRQLFDVQVPEGDDLDV